MIRRWLQARFAEKHEPPFDLDELSRWAVESRAAWKRAQRLRRAARRRLPQAGGPEC